MPRVYLEDDRWSRMFGDVMIVPGELLPSLPSIATNEPTPEPGPTPTAPAFEPKDGDPSTTQPELADNT
jgi:hypothetical protein